MLLPLFDLCLTFSALLLYLVGENLRLKLEFCLTGLRLRTNRWVEDVVVWLY